jgi:asparagine synthase (glutamine-hydrolysing)
VAPIWRYAGRASDIDSTDCGDVLRDPEALSDSQIVLAAFVQWSEACFSRFVGDWALALWSAKDQSLYLARDHAGARTLYFRHEQGEAVWATYLDTFHTRDAKFQLSHDYAACYLAGRFVRDLTPYEGIRSVLPGHYLKIHEGVLSQHQHWSSTVETTLRYDTDAEYEARFLSLFQQSVARRTGPGGTDSRTTEWRYGFNRHRVYVRSDPAEE